MAPTAPLTERLATMVRAPIRTAGFGAITLSMLGAYKIHERTVPKSERETLFGGYRRTWLDRAMGSFGIAREVIPGPPAKSSRARLVVANHRTAIDIPVLLRLFDGQVLSRGDLRNWPLIGTLAQMAGTIFVDREQGMSRAAAARSIRKRLEEGGTVIVFPEGTTHPGDEVRLFQPGAFAAAKGLDVEIVPVGLAYAPGAEFGDETFTRHLGRTAERVRTDVVVCIGDGFDAGDDAREMARASRVKVQELVTKARAAYDARGDQSAR